MHLWVYAGLPSARARPRLPPLNVCLASANGQTLSQPLTGPAVSFRFFHLISAVTLSFFFSVIRLVKEAVIGRLVVQLLTAELIYTHAGISGRQFNMCVRVWQDSQDTNTILWIVGTQKTLTLSVVFVVLLTDRQVGGGHWRSGGAQIGTWRSNPVRQTMKVKWDGSGLKLSGHALARAAGVGTFLCPVHLTSGVIRACRQGESYSSSSRLVIVVVACWGLQRVLDVTWFVSAVITVKCCSFREWLTYNLAIMVWAGDSLLHVLLRKNWGALWI